MKIKSFWNRERKPLTPPQLEIEKKLLPRLKLMGYIFIALSCASLLFVIFQSSPQEISDISNIEIEIGVTEIELNPLEVLNFYAIAFIFASVGFLCFFLTKKKKQELFQESVIKEETTE